MIMRLHLKEQLKYINVVNVTIKVIISVIGTVMH